MDKFAQLSDLEYESDNEDDDMAVEKEKPPILIRDEAHG
jgi:hypothetical protein